MSILPLSFLLTEEPQHPPWGVTLPLPGDTGKGLYPQAVPLFLAQPASGGYSLVFMFFLCILGQEASDGQTEVPNSGCHSCAEFGIAAWRHPAGSIYVTAVLLPRTALLQLSYPLQQHPNASAAARLLPFGLSAFSYSGFALTSVVDSWLWIYFS